MGKNKLFQGKEAFQRMNFLFQASQLLVSHLNQPHLSAYYGSQMTSICKKSVLRMEPRVKREVCKGCRAILVPGISSRVRVKSQKKTLIITCLQCGTLKRFPMTAGFKLWVEEPEACVQAFGSQNEEHGDNKRQLGTKGDPAMRLRKNKNQPETEKEMSMQQIKDVSRSDVTEEEKLQQSEIRNEVPMDV